MSEQVKSSFMEWFVAQHGKRTDSGMDDYSDHLLQSFISRGQLAESVLTQRQLWDARQQSALYAWQAREKEQA